VARWGTAALMTAVVAFVIFSDTPVLPQAGLQPAAGQAHAVLESVPDDGIVLVIFDYDPAAGGELDPLADVLCAHLAKKPNLTLLAISTRAAGPALASRTFARVDRPDSDSAWWNLGYLPGSSVGVRSLVIGMPGGLPSPLARDYSGAETGIEAGSLRALGPDAIVLLVDSAQEARMWVEQLAPYPDVPLVAAASAGAAAFIAPYHESGQIDALITGLPGAAAYQAVGELSAPAGERRAENAQAAGALAALLVIALGSLFYGLERLRPRRGGL